MAHSFASCSSTLYDVRHANNHRSATGLGTTPTPAEAAAGPNRVNSSSEGPVAYLVFVNCLRAPFIPLVGAMEIAGAALGTAPCAGYH